MDSKYCTNCNAQLDGNTKFCPKCGKPNNSIDDMSTLIDKNPKPVSKIIKILLLALIGVIVLFFANKWLMPDFEEEQGIYSITEEISKIEGQWHDPTGVLLGDPNTLIILSKKGDKAIGKDKDEVIKIELTPFGSNNYSGKVFLHGVEGDFEVHFYEEENKLVFFSTLTKTSWNIKRIKD